MLNDHCHRVSTHLQSINIIIIRADMWKSYNDVYSSKMCCTQTPGGFETRVIFCLHNAQRTSKKQRVESPLSTTHCQSVTNNSTVGLLTFLKHIST